VPGKAAPAPLPARLGAVMFGAGRSGLGRKGLGLDFDNRMFALPTALYEARPELARYFDEITDEVREQALETFLPALHGRYQRLQRARRRQFEARIGAGDEVLRAFQQDGVVLGALEPGVRRSLRAYLEPIARTILARLETLAKIKFADGQVPLEPGDHPRLFVEVETALDEGGVLDVFSAYSGERLGLLRLAVQVNTARETRLKYGEIDASGAPRLKTAYFHVDSNEWPQVKALIYLSDVELDQGPFRFVKGSHRLMGDFEALVRKTNDRLRQPPVRFLALPPEFRQHASFGDYIDETTPGAAGLLADEVVVCDGGSDLILFDNNGVHRGGFVRSGHRFMLQCQFDSVARMAERHEGSAAARAALQAV